MSAFWDFFGVGNSAQRRANSNIANEMQDLAVRQEQQALLHEQNVTEEERLGRDAAQRHAEVANINAGNMAAREAEMVATAQQNAAQRALGTRGGSGAGALAGMKAGLQAREGAMAGAFARQQGRQDAARGQLEQSQRQTRQAVNQQQQAAQGARESAAQSRVHAQHSLGQNSSVASNAGAAVGNVLEAALPIATTMLLSDERYKTFLDDRGEQRTELQKSVLELVGARRKKNEG